MNRIDKALPGHAQSLSPHAERPPTPAGTAPRRGLEQSVVSAFPPKVAEIGCRQFGAAIFGHRLARRTCVKLSTPPAHPVERTSSVQTVRLP